MRWFHHLSVVEYVLGILIVTNFVRGCDSSYLKQEHYRYVLLKLIVHQPSQYVVLLIHTLDNTGCLESVVEQLDAHLSHAHET